MRLFVLFAVMGSAMAAPPGMPSFKLHGYSRSNIPEMSVTFENGVTDRMVLEPYRNGPCNFIGKLKSHQGSTAVTGCLNKPGDKMHITLLSELNTKSAAYEMDFDGHLKAIENPFQYQKGPSDIAVPKSRDDGWTNTGEELVNSGMETAEMNADQTVTWPSSLTVYVKFIYENTLKAQLDADETTFPAWIESVMTHVQTYYKDDTLPTDILFEYNTAESIFKDVSWPTTDSLDDAAAAGVEDGDANVDLYAAFGKDTEYYGVVGLAWVGTACINRYKTSFNEWRNTPTAMAWVLAHELGHNFGMSHDFDDKHGGQDGACNGQGIMSYGTAPTQWSACSVSDFTGYYESRDWGNTCFTKGGEAPTATTPVTPTGNSSCVDVTLNTVAWASEISWTIEGPGGSCESTGDYTNNQAFTQSCCGDPTACGDYVLTCKDSYGDGWHGGYLEINGQKFCDQFISGTEHTETLPSPPPAAVNVDVKLTTKNWGSEVSWTLDANCGSPSTQYASFADYTAACSLTPGEYTLTCADSYGDGWHQGFIEIQGTQYCHDFLSGSSATAQVTIAGDCPSPNPPTSAPPTEAPPSSDCGIKPAAIVGGSEVTPYSLPWQVGLVRPGSSSTFCGGTLISDRHVLTAAHCMVVNPLAVVVGEHDITSSEDGTEHAVCRAVTHPNYNVPSQLNNDFAILHLSTPVQIGTRAAPACLATPSMAGDFLVEKPLTVSGWGALQEGGGGPTVLHSVDVPGVTNTVCNGAYNGAITDQMLCAGEPTGGIDSCQGDSGGPLTYTMEGRTYLVGVVSWGIGCAREDRYGVYARVTEEMDWINQQLAEGCTA